MSSGSIQPKRLKLAAASPFRRAVFRGLGVVLPPLLTIAIIFWVWNTIKQYAFEPVTATAREVLVWSLKDVRYLSGPEPLPRETQIDGRAFVRLDGRRYVPKEVVDTVRIASGTRPLPATVEDMYRRYVDLEYLQPWVAIPIFLCVFMLVLYLLGKFLAFGIGRFFWDLFEKGFVEHLPLVRSVYSSVKQVTDLMFSEHEIEFTRIVAVEFPREGMWSVGFVTGESLWDIRAAANEPVLAVLIPYAPLPVTGCVITVRKSEAIDLNITLDQAFQFILSCGVVVPPRQGPGRGDKSLAGSVAGAVSGAVTGGNGIFKKRQEEKKLPSGGAPDDAPGSGEPG